MNNPGSVVLMSEQDPLVTSTSHDATKNNNASLYWRFMRKRQRGLELPEEYFGMLEFQDSTKVTALLQLSETVLAAADISVSATEIEFVLTPEELISNLSSVRMEIVDAISDQSLSSGLASISGATSTKRIPLKGEAIELALWPSGDAKLTVDAPGYELYETDFVTRPGETTDLGKLEMQPALWIRGTVVDTDGSMVSGIHITRALLDPDESTILAVSSGLFMTHNDGTFGIPVRAGKYLLRVHDQPDQSPCVSRSVMADASVSSIEGLEIVVEPPTIVTVIRPQESLGQLDRIRIVDSWGLIIGDVRFDGWLARKLRLPTGLHTLEALDAAGTVVETHSLSVGTKPSTVHVGE